VDETTLSLHPPLRACWMKRGQQKRIPTPGQPQRQHVIGAYDWCANTVSWLTTQCKDSEAFIRFLERLLVEQHPHEVAVLVMDNGSIHKAAAVQAALSLFEHRVQVVFLPPYCSTLNPIERYWRHLKDTACVNKLYPCLDELVTAVESTLAAQNDPLNPHRFLFLTDIVSST
jgi:putative transposase